MSEPIVLLDPTAEGSPAARPRLARPASLEGLTVALIDIAKPRGDVFLDRIAERLAERGFAVERFMKPRFSVIAPDALKQAIAARCQLAIEALAD
jgi:hypothetical protein